MYLSEAELESLTEAHNEWHVSIYMPTLQAGDDILENSVRFENLVDRAEEQLVEAGMRRPEAEGLLSPARALIEDEIFWQQQSEGLAVFLTEDMARKYWLPLDLDEVVVVSDRFHVKPLLSVLSNNGRFYVLALSQHETRLLQGTRHRIGEINLDDREQVPDSIVEVLKWDDPEERIQLHTSTEAVLDGGVAAVFHGHGVASQDDPDEKVLRYFHRLDAGISDLLADDDAPMVPVADDFVLALYREANTYPHLTEEGVGEEPQRLSAETLHQGAWAIVEPLFAQAEEQARDAYKHLQGTESDRVSDDVERVVQAAAFGRVEGLFVPRGAQVWGTFDRETGDVEIHEEQEPGDRDLLDVAAAETMLNEGWLFVVDPADVPDEGHLAAVFRW